MDGCVGRAQGTGDEMSRPMLGKVVWTLAVVGILGLAAMGGLGYGVVLGLWVGVVLVALWGTKEGV